MPMIENFSEFRARQACECLQVERGDFRDAWLFANGAACVLNKVGVLNGTLEIREPPTEKFTLLRAKRLFVAEKLGRESRNYQAALAAYQEQAGLAARYPASCPAVPSAAMDVLRSGWDFIESLRQELEKIDSELANSPEGILVRQRRELNERDAANRAVRQRTADSFACIASTGQPPTRDIVEEVGEYLQNQ